MTEPIELNSHVLERLSLLSSMIEKCHSAIIMIVALESFNDKLYSELGIDDTEINVSSYMSKLEENVRTLKDYIERASELL